MTEDVKIKQDEAQLDAATEVENQAEVKPTFTQDQLERVVEERLARQRRTLLKKYEGVDVEKYNTLVEEQEHKEKEAALKRQEFDTVLKSTVEKKDTTISKLQSELLRATNERCCGIDAARSSLHRFLHCSIVCY